MVCIFIRKNKPLAIISLEKLLETIENVSCH